MASSTKIIVLISVLIGAVLGFTYWFFVGCETGSCPITSKWPVTMAYGGLMGGLLGYISLDFRKKDDSKTGG